MSKWCVYIAIKITDTGEISSDKGVFSSLKNALNYIAFCIRFGTPVVVKLQRLPIYVPFLIKVPKVK